jgi:Predicted membrane protein
MTKLTAILSATLLAATAGLVQARDIAPEEAVQLLNAGTIQSFEKLNEAALAQHPGGTIDDAELEEKRGRYVYEVEIVDAQGVEWDLDLDAATGEVLKNRKDD